MTIIQFDSETGENLTPDVSAIGSVWSKIAAAAMPGISTEELDRWYGEHMDNDDASKPGRLRWVADGDDDPISSSTAGIAGEIAAGRIKAHAKHGANSIEATPAESLQWLAILGEEFGEAAHELTYDAGGLVDVYDYQPLDGDEFTRRKLQRLRAELIDVATVAVAWAAAIDREIP